MRDAKKENPPSFEDQMVTVRRAKQQRERLNRAVSGANSSSEEENPCWAITAALKSLFPGVMEQNEEYTENVIRPQIREYVDKCLSPCLSGALEERGFSDNLLKAVGKMASFTPVKALEDAPYSEALSDPMEAWRGAYYASYQLAPVRWLAGTPIVRDQLARDIFALWSAGKEASKDANFLPSDLENMLKQYEVSHGADPQYKINRAKLLQAMKRAQNLNLKVSDNLRSNHSE